MATTPPAPPGYVLNSAGRWVTTSAPGHAPVPGAARGYVLNSFGNWVPSAPPGHGPAATTTKPAPTSPPIVIRPTGTSKGPTPEEIARRAAAEQARAIAAAQAKADAEAAAAKKKAGQGYLERAGNLQAQIDALQHALGDQGFKAALDQNLADLLAGSETGLEVLRQGHAARAAGFLGTAEDTEKAQAQLEGSTFENLVRERQDTMSNLMLQGAGETDSLRAMVMAARNFRDNQSEGNRAYFDSMRSVGTGVADLNQDTLTAMHNSVRSTEAERERLWQDFYNRRSEAYTQLGNVYGQQADYYISAEENDVSSGGRKDAAKASSGEAFMNAAKEAGRSYVQQGTPAWLRDWKGVEAPQARQANTDLAAAVQYEPLGKAEGATLRGW